METSLRIFSACVGVTWLAVAVGRAWALTSTGGRMEPTAAGLTRALRLYILTIMADWFNVTLVTFSRSNTTIKRNYFPEFQFVVYN